MRQRFIQTPVLNPSEEELNYLHLCHVYAVPLNCGHGGVVMRGRQGCRSLHILSLHSDLRDVIPGTPHQNSSQIDANSLASLEPPN